MGIQVDGDKSILGYGLLQPLQRAGGADFNAAGGRLLVEACVRQILATKRGELRWRPRFGNDVERLRLQAMDPVMRELVRAEIAGTLKTWEPRITVDDVTPTVDTLASRLHVKVTWRVIDRNHPRNNVILGPTVQEVSI